MLKIMWPNLDLGMELLGIKSLPLDIFSCFKLAESCVIIGLGKRFWKSMPLFVVPFLLLRTKCPTAKEKRKPYNKTPKQQFLMKYHCILATPAQKNELLCSIYSVVTSYVYQQLCSSTAQLYAMYVNYVKV